MEPTQPVQYPYGYYDRTVYQPNPYELTPIPPPPPKKSRMPLLITLLLFITALLVFGSAGLFYLAHMQPVNKEQTTPVVTTPITQQNYTADNILEDMVNKGCPCTTNVQHDLPPGDFIDNGSGEQTSYISVTATSSVSWDDQTSNVSPTGGLWIYKDNNDAASAYAQVGKYEQKEIAAGATSTTVSTEETHNRCLLILVPSNGGNGLPWPGYQQALDQYCL